MHDVYIAIRRGLIMTACTVALVGMWQSSPDVFARVCATILFALVIAMCMFTRFATEPKRIPIVEHKPAPTPPRDYNAPCVICKAPFGDLRRGIECTAPDHHAHALHLLGRSTAK